MKIKNIILVTIWTLLSVTIFGQDSLKKSPTDKLIVSQKSEVLVDLKNIDSIEKLFQRQEQNWFTIYGTACVAIAALLGTIITSYITNRRSRINTEYQLQASKDNLTNQLAASDRNLQTQITENKLQDVVKKKRELISRGRAKMYLISQILKDLAMYKVHKQYYIKAFQLGTDQADKNDSYKKHYDKGQEQRITESKLDENIAEYFQLVTEFIILTNQNDHFKQHFESIYKYAHPKASKFDDCTTLKELEERQEIEEKRLNEEEYVKLRNLFETIQTEMEKI